MSLFNIMRKIEIDAGHRVPFHNSKCKNLHGHRYVVEVNLEATGVIPDLAQDSESGMVMDFGLIKQVLMETINDVYDHGLILWAHDPLLDHPGFTESLAAIHQKLILTPVIPTAEQLALLWCGEFTRTWRERLQIRHITLAPIVRRFRVWETPNSYADYYPDT